MRALDVMVSALLLGLPACTGMEGEGDDPNDHGEDVIWEPCLTEFVWKVDPGETLTFLTGMQSTIDSRGTGRYEAGPMTSPREPRFRAEEHHHQWDGWAKLYWNDALVDSFEFDQAFLLAHGTRIMRHVEPDGSGVELHILSRPKCLPPFYPGDEGRVLLEDHPLTRAEVESFEGIAQ